MNDGETKYVVARMSLGQLRECGISASDISTSKFGYKITQKSHDFEYGTHHYYQIEIFTEGKYKDIEEINDIKISYLVPYRTTLYRSYNKIYKVLTFEYLSKNRDVCQIELEEIYSSTLLHSIIFAIIFLSEFEDKEEMKEIWKFLFDEKKIEIGKAITLLKKASEKSKLLIEKYPLMKELINKRLKRRIELIKTDLQEISILK